MTRLSKKSVTCPNCGATVGMHIVRTTNTLGGRTTDFRPVALGGQPLAHLMHTCPSCGMTGEERDFSSAVDDRIRALIAEHLTPSVRAETPAPSRRYEFAARLAEWHGRPAGTVGQHYLSAAWCCVDEGSAAEADYRRRAIVYFQRALAGDELGTRDRVVFTYLVGEPHRRLGHPGEAVEWLGRAEDLARTSEEAWIEALARRQATDPQDML
jgi:predicted RNA-binding Zn-ribbon protein involved in translation (DUF1610 family)